MWSDTGLMYRLGIGIELGARKAVSWRGALGCRTGDGDLGRRGLLLPNIMR